MNKIERVNHKHDEENPTDFDDAIRLTGYGRFHYEIFAVSALSILSMGFQNGLSSYVFPAATCELNLTSYQIGILNVGFMIGGLVSCFIWGILADNFGRKKILFLAHVFDAVVTIICGMLPGSTILLICRVLNGFFVGAPGSIIFTYIAEFQPPKYRSSSVCCCGIFFTLSWLLLPLAAYIVLPLEHVNVNVSNIIIITPWRLLLILLAVPELLTALWLLKVPETPKFFLAKNKEGKCIAVLRRMYSVNTKNEPHEFPIKNLAQEFCVREISTRDNENEKKNNLNILTIMKQQLQCLFKKPLAVVTALACAIMFANMFGMFGLGLWLPEIFVRFEQYEKLYPNSTPSIKELSHFHPIKSNETCDPTFDSTVTFNTVIIATISLIYNIICGLLSTKLHFTIVPLVSMLIGAVSSSSFYFLRTAWQNLIMASVFQAGMITANMTIGNIAVELFPTEVVGFGLSLILFSGRIGAVVSGYLFGYFMDSNCAIPIFCVAVVVLIGGLLTYVIPRKHPKSNKIVPTTSINNNEIETVSMHVYDVKVS